MALVSRCLFVVVSRCLFVVTFAASVCADLPDSEQGPSCGAEVMHDEKANFASLLQAKHGVARTAPLQDSSHQASAKPLALPAAAIHELQKEPANTAAEAPVAKATSEQPASTFADAADKECVVGGGCSTEEVPAARAVCVAKAEGCNECWDVCNMAHKPEDYQTGNVMLDIKVRDSVEAIRKITCQSDTTNPEVQLASPKPEVAAEDLSGEAVAVAAPLDAVGYNRVAALKSHSAMEAYIRRVVSNSGCRVADESSLEGVVPFYSGETAKQTYAALEAEIYRACTGTGTWLSSLYPHSVLAEQEALQATLQLGSTAPITERGFQEVVNLKDELQMIKYVRRVVSMLHGWVVDESGLRGLLPFFTGEKSVQTLGALILEIQSAMQKPDGWVMKATASLTQHNGTDEEVPGSSISLIGEDAEVERRLNQSRLEAAIAFEECPDDDLEEMQALNHTAWLVPLDDSGYQAIAQLKSDCAMLQFALRVVQEFHCHVLDDSGLKGVVPFYSGTQGLQDIHELRMEVKGACTMEGKWLVPDVKYWSNHPDAAPTDVAEVESTETDTTAEEAASGVDSGVPVEDSAQPISLIAQNQTRSSHAARGSAKSAKGRNSWMCRAFQLFCH